MRCWTARPPPHARYGLGGRLGRGGSPRFGAPPSAPRNAAQGMAAGCKGGGRRWIRTRNLPAPHRRHTLRRRGEGARGGSSSVCDRCGRDGSGPKRIPIPPSLGQRRPQCAAPGQHAQAPRRLPSPRCNGYLGRRQRSRSSAGGDEPSGAGAGARLRPGTHDPRTPGTGGGPVMPPPPPLCLAGERRPAADINTSAGWCLVCDRGRHRVRIIPSTPWGQIRWSGAAR